MIVESIKRIHSDSKGRYGAPRIYRVLLAEGGEITQSTVSRWMKEIGLRAKTVKRFRIATTDSKHTLPVVYNVLGRNFMARSPGEIFTSDITYIPPLEGWLYLAIMLDLGTRKAAGWSMGGYYDGKTRL